MKSARTVGTAWVLSGTSALVGCSPAPVEPAGPGWADVAPILRGECNSCHGWTAKDTGGSYRFDFFEMSADVCGKAAAALDSGLILAGNSLAAGQIKNDIIKQKSAPAARMPPPPSPALPDWERDVLTRWTAKPILGTPPEGNRPPTIELSNYPATANQSLSFTVVLEDPDGDAALGIIEVNGLALLMNRTGSFGALFDTSAWPAGKQPVTAYVCDGWTQAEYHLGDVQISH